MELLICIAAATVGWVVRALWYMVLRSPFERALAAPVRNTGHPARHSPLPYLLAGTCLLVMAVVMRALFLRYGISGLGEGLMVGTSIGALIGLPLTIMHNIPPRHANVLTAIDGVHAVLQCAVLGAILGAL